LSITHQFRQEEEPINEEQSMTPGGRNHDATSAAPKILIVDDEYFSSRLLMAMLEQEGFQIW
jgi:PleD family two-component response regulator